MLINYEQGVLCILDNYTTFIKLYQNKWNTHFIIDCSLRAEYYVVINSEV